MTPLRPQDRRNYVGWDESQEGLRGAIRSDGSDARGPITERPDHGPRAAGQRCLRGAGYVRSCSCPR